MKTISRLALLLAPVLLVACQKKEPVAAPAVVVPAPVAAPAAAPTAAAPAAPAAVDPASMTAEQRDQAEKQERFDYGAMEDKYINDPRAQWASGASASSTYGDPKPDEGNLPKTSAVGPVDGKHWINNNQEIGFDWLAVDYAKPVAATEVRLVIEDGRGIEALSKVELQDTDGKWNTIWTGLSDVKQDHRGARTWFVRTFPKTAYKVKTVKYTFANNVQRGYKYVDAAQLIGDQ
ncbi:MAG: hypothetical protein V4484_04290 [Pseudomonadota bacterium]